MARTRLTAQWILPLALSGVLFLLLGFAILLRLWLMPTDRDRYPRYERDPVAALVTRVDIHNPNTKRDRGVALSVAKPSEEPLPTPTPTLAPPVRLATGEEIRGEPASGLGTLTITNGQDYDAFVKLRKNGKTCRGIYIRAGEETVLKKIASGSYTILFTMGWDWDKQRQAFRQGATFGQFDTPQVFTEKPTITRTAEGQDISTPFYEIKITLYRIQNGNLSAHDITENEFGKN